MLADFVKLLRPGEMVLVEYSLGSPELALLELEGNLVVDDILDAFPEALSRLEVMGYDVSRLLDVPVVKIGGSRRAGRVVGVVDVDRHSLDFRYYERLYSMASPGFAINPVLGFHKLFPLLTDRELLRLIRNVASFVGRRDRVALYFVNADVLSTRPHLWALLRETATTVVKLEDMEVVRTLNPGLR